MYTLDIPETMCSGRRHIIDFGCRGQKRVVMNTFVAQIDAAIDTLESGYLIQLAYCEIVHRDLIKEHDSKLDKAMTTQYDKLSKLSEVGRLLRASELGIDARSVFAIVEAVDVRDPSECSLKVHVLSSRGAINRGKLRALFWSDTRDMIADGLTKGGLDRTQLVNAMEHGSYRLEHEWKVVRSSKSRENVGMQVPDEPVDMI